MPTRELIAYLALHPQGGKPRRADRRALALTRPQEDPHPPMGISQRRTRRARRRLDRGRRALSSRPQQGRIDLDQLDRPLTSTENEPHALEAALKLWRGEPLQGSDYARADGHIHSLRGTLIGLLERAGNTRLEHSDARGALELAQQAIALDQFPRGILAARKHCMTFAQLILGRSRRTPIMPATIPPIKRPTTTTTLKLALSALLSSRPRRSTNANTISTTPILCQIRI